MALAAFIILGSAATAAATGAAATATCVGGGTGEGGDRCQEVDGPSLLQVHGPAVERGAVPASGLAAASRGLVVEWNFTKGDPEAVKRWLAWDRSEGWSAPSRPGVDLSDFAAWPELTGTPGGWDFGLKDPQYFVLSMPSRTTRRQRFKEQIGTLCLGADMQWAPALDGSKIPTELRWMNGFEDKKAWDYPRPGNWACYASHLAILRQAHAECPGCDLVVFEDDIVFAPDFKRRWASFVAALPADWELLRIGGQSQWSPPKEVTEDYIHSKAVANTWGYVVRARSVDLLARRLADLPVRGNWGVDAVLQLFSEELPMYSPVVPLVHAASSCHDTERHINDEDCETAETLRRAEQQLYARWPLGYARTYCRDRGATRDSTSLLQADADRDMQAMLFQLSFAELKEHCPMGDTSDACCPYTSPPHGLLSGHNAC